jgi:hypothetical protein
MSQDKFSQEARQKKASQLVADRERVLGPEHPDTLTARVDLLMLLFPVPGDAGAWQGLGIARDWEDLATDCKRVLGPDHPNTRIAQGQLVAWQSRLPSYVLDDPSWR